MKLLTTIPEPAPAIAGHDGLIVIDVMSIETGERIRSSALLCETSGGDVRLFSETMQLLYGRDGSFIINKGAIAIPRLARLSGKAVRS